MATKINFNGDIQDDACISVFDHGFLFGDSVYEVVSTQQNKPVFLTEHLNRLENSANEIFLKIPKDNSWFEDQITRTLSAANNDESYIRIVVTRGVGEIDIDPMTCKVGNTLIYVTDCKEYPKENYENGIQVAVVSIKRNPREALDPGIKTGNYLNNILAKMEANKLGAKDALMLNGQGFITECTTSNFFFVQDGRIYTPSLDVGILPGITRVFILKVALENDLLVEEGKWPLEVLDKADEMFLTGTLKKVMPVTQLDSRMIGNGKPGPVTKKIMHLYQEFLDRQV
jgi:branched-chain amino acid aminotransferase